MSAQSIPLRPTLASVPTIRTAQLSGKPGGHWMVEFDDGTGMGGITKREAMRTARHELKQGRRVTIIPPAAA